MRVDTLLLEEDFKIERQDFIQRFRVVEQTHLVVITIQFREDAETLLPQVYQLFREVSEIRQVLMLPLF